MQLAEISQHILRPNLDGAGTSGMQPTCAAGHDLQRLHRRAGGRQQCERVTFGIERIGHGRTRPVPPLAFRRRKTVANAGCGDELILRPVALEHLADFEKRHIGKAAIAV